MLHGEVITDADPTQIITRGKSGVEGVYTVTGGPLYHGDDIIGAVAFFLYASCVSWLMMRHKVKGLLASGASIIVWAAAAFGLWFLWWARA